MGFHIKKAFKKIGHAVSKAAKGFTHAVPDIVKSVGRGDIKGVADAALRGVSMGTYSVEGKGLVTPKTFGMGATMSDAGSGVSMPATVKKKNKGLVTSLRSGKGGGGSWTETAKDPLGGESGKTGK